MTEAINISGILELLHKQYALRENTDNLLFYGKGIVAEGKKTLPVQDVYSLLYFFDQCKKGYYEDLKNNKRIADGYFARIAAYQENESGSGLAYLFHAVPGNMFMAHHCSMRGAYPGKAVEMLKQSLEYCDQLSAVNDDHFFPRLRVFVWLSYQKALIKQGEAAFAMNDMTAALTGWLRKKGSAAIQEEETDNTILAVFNVLYSFSLLSPSFGKYFKTVIADLATFNMTNAGSDNFITHFLQAQKAVTMNDRDSLFNQFGNMLVLSNDCRQLYMLAAVFTEVDNLLMEEQDDRREEINTLFYKLAKTELPAYLLNKVFKENKSLAITN